MDLRACFIPGAVIYDMKLADTRSAHAEDDEYEKSRYGQHNGAALSDEEMEDAIPAFQEHEVDISDSD